jgi:hypothetical protein
MALSDDPWIAKHSIIDPERVHALGVITLLWNHCERNLLHIFSRVFDLNGRQAWIIAHDMGDVSMRDRISEALKWSSYDDTWRDVISSYLDCYDVSRQNRNALTRFTASIPDKTVDLSAATFVRLKGVKGSKTSLPSTLTDIRRIAEETSVLMIYSWNLFQALSALKKGQQPELLPKLLPPELLVKPPQKTNPKPTRPPKPFQESGKT